MPVIISPHSSYWVGKNTQPGIGEEMYIASQLSPFTDQ